MYHLIEMLPLLFSPTLFLNHHPFLHPMVSDKVIKKEFKVTASQNPDQYYATAVLKKEGFMRKQCACKTYYWTTDKDRSTCDDPTCSGGFRFTNDSPVKEKLNYIQVWQRFAAFFKKRGYTPIPRYPVAARWRDDIDIVFASICDFQPHVVSGEVEPPANPLVIPQFSLRFNDIDNVGKTCAHFTGFVMIGQHTFVPEEEWDQDNKTAWYYVHNNGNRGTGPDDSWPDWPERVSQCLGGCAKPVTCG